ncbi:MAG TPA: aldehyde dehydrogenase family protein [Marmoricola sp.]|nr:aldehyde dehydrogenase family protein [Marmoricola sp.]
MAVEVAEMTQVSYSPRSGLSQGEVADSTAAEVRVALEAAASVAPLVADAAPATRRQWAYAIADALEANLDELAQLAESETALGMPRLTGEVQRAAGQLRFYADVAVEGSYLGAVIDRSTEPPLARVNVPLGPVAVFGASNFPFAFGVLGNDTASALAAGCPVIAKGHPAHPLLSVRLAEISLEALADAGAPPGVLGLVMGREVGVDLVRAPEIAAVGFTGSQAGGLALWRIANERDVVIPVFAEMGTVNPMVVTRDAASRMSEIAKGFVGSFTLGSGQFCTKPGLLLAPSGLDAAAQVAKALRAAAPTPVMLTEAIADSVRRGLDELVAAGGRVVDVVEPEGGWAAPAAVIEVDAAQLCKGSRLLEECFGAVALVAEYADAEELDEVLDNLQGALAAGVLTDGESDAQAATLITRLSGKVGRVLVDGWPTGVAFTWAQQHGGPWPATSAPAVTSVGAAALGRFVRPIAFQNVPDHWLPEAVQDRNPWSIPRRVDGVLELGR